jgi:hypothetical protein
MSPIARRIEEARETATQLGHKLSGFRFKYGLGLAECQTCGCTLCVSDATIGAAVTLPCKHGEPEQPKPVRPALPTGRAKPLPKPAPVSTFDDVPFPTDAPVRDAVVLR